MHKSVFERLLESRLTRGIGMAAALCLPLSSQAAGLADIAAKIWDRTTVYGFTQDSAHLNNWQQNKVNGLAVVVKAPQTTAGHSNQLQTMARNIHTVSDVLGPGFVVSDVSTLMGEQDVRFNAKDKGRPWVPKAIAATIVVGGTAALVINGNRND